MRRPAKATLRFVRALLAVGAAKRVGDHFEAGDVRLEAARVRELIAEGVLAGDAAGCRPLAGTAQWVKRQMLQNDEFSAQHRIEVPGTDGVILNLAESPLARLAAANGEEPAFLQPHQVEAGERIRRLVQRAQLQPRLTMSYSLAHTATSGGSRAGDLGDMAVDARAALADLYRQLPRDCADIILDICGFEKGLQQVESERGWPRRSAKLVLRIGLDRLAELYGLAAIAIGPEAQRRRAWMAGARPTMFE